MSAIDRLTDRDIAHLQDRHWKMLTRVLGHIPGNIICQALCEADWPRLANSGVSSDADIAKTLRVVAQTYETLAKTLQTDMLPTTEATDGDDEEEK